MSGVSDAEMDALTGALCRDLAAAGPCHLLIGIPSRNNQSTIGHVAASAVRGVLEYLPGVRAVVLNADTHSQDQTVAAFLAAVPPCSGVPLLSTQFTGIPGKGSAVRTIFQAAVQLRASGCVLLDADLRSVRSEWVPRLAMPVLQDRADLVVPNYRRHQHDGTVTNFVAYPLTRALYGRRVRQPIGGDFGVASRLCIGCLEQDVWRTDVARFGIDIFLTTTALAKGFRVAAASLGTKVHDPKDPAGSLGPTFVQVVGTLFRLAAAHFPAWADTQGSQPLESDDPPLPGEVDPVQVSLDAQIRGFLDGLAAQRPVVRHALPPELAAAVEGVAEDFRAGSIRFPVGVWRDVLFHAIAQEIRTPSRPFPVEALTPLFFGRVASFIRETRDMSAPECEALIEANAEEFERAKSALLAACRSVPPACEEIS